MKRNGQIVYSFTSPFLWKGFFLIAIYKSQMHFKKSKNDNE